MKKITMTLLMLTITLAASAQNAVDDLIGKLLKTYPKTPSREMLDKNPETGKLLRHITEYTFRDIKPKKFVPLINALRDSQNGYYTQESTIDGNGYVYELRIADIDPDYRTVYILETKGNDADLHVLYGKMPYSEMSTNFSYSPDKYYTIINKLTGAKLGMSFDYNNHASTYKESTPSGQGPNGIIITDRKVFRFKFVPTIVVDTRFTDSVSEDCFIVTEDLFALEDGSEAEEGQWLIFRYLNKNNPFQQWKLIDKDGVVTIINKATGRCIDLAGGETKEGAAVFSYDINEDPQSNANQKWVIEKAD
ncbi:MAG: RICIN domain-containing protein [Prevotella sp.]|nr:RICIN domain-containing protein [Prevotella sp.]